MRTLRARRASRHKAVSPAASRYRGWTVQRRTVRRWHEGRRSTVRRFPLSPAFYHLRLLSSKILLPQRSHMPQLVPRDVESKTADRRDMAVHLAFALPGFPRQSGQERDRRLAHGAVLLEQVRERARLEVGRGDIEFLVEARQRKRLAASHAQ